MNSYASLIKSYISLTKPGIIFGNLITAVAGFFLASKGHINLGSLLAMVIGMSLVIGSACVFNNIIDREIDKKMDRTKKRALVQGFISVKHAFMYGVLLCLVGSVILVRYDNLLTASVGLFGVFMYVVVYGVWKRRSPLGTIVGSISGAVPPVVGYVAVTNNLDLGSWLLFLILVIWQMPHFYAIAIYRAPEYAAASIPVLPVKENINVTKIHILLYTVAFIIAASLLTVFHYTGYVYFVIMLVGGLYWLFLSVKGFKTSNDIHWAKNMFRFSLIIIIVFSLAISLNVIFPL